MRDASSPRCPHSKIPQAWRGAELCTACVSYQWLPDDPALDAAVTRSLRNGPGIAILRGVPVGSGDVRDAEALALDIARRLGTPLPQDEGRLTCLVQNEGHVLRPGSGSRLLSRTAKSSKSSERLEFHNDNAPGWSAERVDVLAMLAVRQAVVGGDTILASARVAYETLQRESPKAAVVLAEDFVFDCTTASSARRSTSVGPVFSGTGPDFAMRCNRVRIETAAADSGTPLSRQRTEALDALDEVLARPEMHFRFRLRPGECLVLNDHTVVHGRTAYRDAPAAPRRCLVRVWIRAFR